MTDEVSLQAHRTWSVHELAAESGGVVLGGERVHDSDAGIATNDTRNLQPGGVFCALQGVNMHGLSLWRQAQDAGAVAVLCGADAPPALVREAREGLGDDVALVTYSIPGVDMVGVVGRAWRRRAGFRVVGITGSSGKTTCKEIARELFESAFSVVASSSNNNNELGVPLTLLSAPVGTDVVICEMGMRGLGQIEYLCDIAEPDVGIITSIGSAHLELLGSLDNIARAKSEIVAGVRDGTAVIPADRIDLVGLSASTPGRVMLFATESRAGDIWIQSCDSIEAGIRGIVADGSGWSSAFAIPFHGVHNSANLAAACCAFRALGGSRGQLEAALARPIDAWQTTIDGRGDRVQTSDHGLVINDAYNANPESMRAALDELVRVTPAHRRVAILGYMAELGVDSPQLHADIGAYAASLAIDALVLVDTHADVAFMAAAWKAARGTSPQMLSSAQALLERGATWRAGTGGVTLIKASNSVGLGRVVDELVERYGVAAAHQRFPEGNPT